MAFSYGNIIIITVMILVGIIIIYFIFKKDPEPEEDTKQEDIYSISYLIQGVRNLFNEIINQNIAQLYLNRKETKKREQQKARLITALRCCAQGKIGEKEYVKDYMKDLLQSNLNINENTIDRIIPFHAPSFMTAQDKFEILLYIMKKEYSLQAFHQLSALCGFEKPKKNAYGTYYEITDQDVHLAYELYAKPLCYLDKLNIVTQRVYQGSYGFSIADELRDMNIDGISGGVSGITTEQYNYLEEVFLHEVTGQHHAYDSLWIFLHGKAIRMSFLRFGSLSELIRVCKNLYSYDNVGHLTSTNGYKLTYLQDGSRVVVVRPKLSTHWAFFVRKFDSAKNMGLMELIRDEGKENVVEVIKWAVRGCLNIILSGDQNSGKTTALKAMIRYIDQKYPIRTTEQEFELWLNHAYPKINVISFRASEEVSIINAINIQKKTDASIMILGEVASNDLAAAFITLTQAGTKATMCTCHCVSTEDLVDYFRNAILSEGTFSNELIAEEQVANAINIDIHWEKSGDGHRYISYIREIIPYPRDEKWPENTMDCIAEGLKRMSRKRTFYSRDIIVYKDGRYIRMNSFSDRLANKIAKNLNQYEKEAFHNFNNIGG
ncbi:Flp pilus assembly complex ATPase component TadA [Mobilitalea sibirica]|uniref:Flp pilus assembly complex ATPase component TadA n=1 Tax=Mobilitalea sibirica TaxID=1462919 RepID=A0A8J7H201_9FIRM|nr:ATPase, T2SS/T4P/T4SS family [Mobilitalea sibirica]MBH1940633.1 Flp pilus assembly complex ATPase component TadA [Mobilitalea sibirica]